MTGQTTIRLCGHLARDGSQYDAVKGDCLICFFFFLILIRVYVLFG